MPTATNPPTKPMPTVTTATPIVAPAAAAYLAPSASLCLFFLLLSLSLLKNLECKYCISDSMSSSESFGLILTLPAPRLFVVSFSCCMADVSIASPSSSTSTMVGIRGSSSAVSLDAVNEIVGRCRDPIVKLSPSTLRTAPLPLFGERKMPEFGVEALFPSSRLRLTVRLCCAAPDAFFELVFAVATCFLLFDFRKIPLFFFGSSGTVSKTSSISSPIGITSVPPPE
mmetsp:Transcript_26536/g.55533  ORF Transcript_26536/g.55533 Transcript_26536/m.55533 type:complete len:227 (+) Transcript_26536:3126-3806(+)